MAKDPIKKAENGTYYFRANLGFHPITGKQIQKYKVDSRQKRSQRSIFKTYADIHRRINRKETAAIFSTVY